MIRKTAAAMVAASVVMSLGSVAPAMADDDAKIRRGGCSGSATWKLKVKPDDGRLEVEAEVDSNVTGQVWRWRIKHNGSVSARGKKKTTGRSGSFSVERHMANLSGKDVFRFRAKHGDQVCRGRISW